MIYEKNKLHGFEMCNVRVLFKMLDSYGLEIMHCSGDHEGSQMLLYGFRENGFMENH